MSGLYDKIKTAYKLLFVFTIIITLASCSSYKNEEFSWPGADTGIVTRNPDILPDIRWQTPDQRKNLSAQLAKEREEETARQGRLIPTSDIEWRDNPYLGAEKRLEKEDSQRRTSPLDDRLSQNEKTREEIINELSSSPVAMQREAAPSMLDKKFKVHLLIPLSGDKSDIGMAMINAAQLALFDVGSDNFELIPVDTKGTRIGARQAAEQAIKEKSDLILGPVFSEDLQEIKPLLAKSNIPVISFTNNWKLADKNTYIMGFMPFTQVSRVTQYAVNRGYRNFAAYAPSTEYCDAVVQTMQNTLRNSPATIVDIGRYASQQRDISNLVNDFIYRHKTIIEPEEEEEEISRKLIFDEATGELVPAPKPIKEEDEKTEEEKEEDFKLSFDTLMLPLGGEGLRSIINQLEINNVDQKKVKYIGTGLWDDNRLNSFPSMFGAWFAAPDPKMIEDFNNRFKENFGTTPVRIASLAYDATALAAVLARQSRDGKSPYARDNLTNPRGFAGIDGIFRFRDDGLSERGLAILEIRAGQMRVIDRAPTAFLPRGN